MSSPDLSEDRVAKYVVAGIAILALVAVALIDANSAETVSPFVYGALAGAVVGADNVIRWFKK